MPRGRPKGSRNLSAYERGKVKRIREILSQKGINDFDRFRDQQVLNNIYVNTEGEIFVKYGLDKNFTTEKVSQNRNGEKILAKLEKNIALLRTGPLKDQTKIFIRKNIQDSGNILFFRY